MNDIKHYLEQLNNLKFNDGGFYKFLLSKGNSLKPNKLDEKIEKDLIEKYFIHPRKKGCYYNAQQLTIYSKGKYDYYEGYAISKILNMPLEHAWNVYDGKIIDISWKDGLEYFGIKMPYPWIKKQFYKFVFKYNVSDSHLIRYWEYCTNHKIVI